MSISSKRLAAVRAELARQGMDGFIVPRADEHLGEYVPPSAERLAWLTGFTGSAGMAVVLANKAAVFIDGRYVLQVAQQTEPELWERRHITDDPPPSWIATNAPAGARIGYDPWLISQEALGRFVDAGLAMEPVATNPIDACWTGRAPPPTHPAVPHQLEYAGRTSGEKRHEIGRTLQDAKQDAAIITDPASLAWLLNIRGADVPFTPFALGFSIVHADGSAELFMDPAKLSEETRRWLGNEISVADRSALPRALERLKGRRVRLDPANSPVWFAQRLRAVGSVVTEGPDPCLLPKACKNPVEQQGARNAHLRDAVAVCRFLHWLASAGRTGDETEISAATHLLGLREAIPDFRGESFGAISGAGEHGAIIHYRVTPETNRHLGANETYLIDSGAQDPGRHNRHNAHHMDRTGSGPR